MPSFDNLLGFKDFGEALFAQTQLEDETRKFPGYAIAEKAQIAELAAAVASLTTTTTSGLSITVPTVVEFNADFEGNIGLGQLPHDVEVAASLLGLDVLGDTRLEVIFTPNGVTGSETVDGTFEITGVNKVNASIGVLINFAGVKQGDWVIAVNIVKGAAPPVVVPPAPGETPPPPAPGVATPAVSLPLAAANLTSFKLLASVEVAGGFSYKAAVSAPFASPESNGIAANISIYIAHRLVGGAWVQDGVVVEADPTYYEAVEGDYPTYFSGGLQRNFREQFPGSVLISRDLVLPSGTYEIGFFAKLLYGSAVNFFDAATVRPL